jgi:hypothetical protein
MERYLVHCAQVGAQREKGLTWDIAKTELADRKPSGSPAWLRTAGYGETSCHRALVRSVPTFGVRCYFFSPPLTWNSATDFPAMLLGTISV